MPPRFLNVLCLMVTCLQTVESSESTSKR